MREIILDTETTGLDPNKGHRITDIGCVELIDHIPTGRVFQVYVNPERDVPKEVEAICGLPTEFFYDKPKFHEIVDGFLDFIQDDTLVIHNAQFDIKFLNSELQRVGKRTLSLDKTVDTLLMARKMFPGAPASLDALCKRFKVDLSARQKHGALLDCQLLAEVYINLLGGKQSSLFGAPKKEEKKPTRDIKIEPTAGIVKPQNVIEMKKPVTRRTPVRMYEISEEELKAHNDSISTIKNPIWAKYKK